eukprot:gene8062-8257_t
MPAPALTSCTRGKACPLDATRPLGFHVLGQGQLITLTIADVGQAAVLGSLAAGGGTRVAGGTAAGLAEDGAGAETGTAAIKKGTMTESVIESVTEILVCVSKDRRDLEFGTDRDRDNALIVLWDMEGRQLHGVFKHDPSARLLPASQVPGGRLHQKACKKSAVAKCCVQAMAASLLALTQLLVLGH